MTCISAGETLGVDPGDAVGVGTNEYDADDAVEPALGSATGYPASPDTMEPNEKSGT